MFPADTTAWAFPSPIERHAATSELSGFARTASAGFSSIAITCVVTTCSSPRAVDRGVAEEDRDDPVRGGFERAGHHLVRAAVAAHGVHRHPDGLIVARDRR